MKAILNDVTRCTGCEKCVAACVEANSLGPVLPAQRSSRDRLSGQRLCSVAALPGGAFARKSCQHCVEPACVEACLVGAMTKTADGPVVYDKDKCIGCRYCMLACAFGVPRYEWEETLPFIRKCTMCNERVAEGKLPACVEACPHEALLFGERDEVLAEAHRRLEATPGLYVPRVYGEQDLGGTCVLYISPVPLDSLGWPEALGSKAIPEYTWPLISKTPAIALTVAGCLSAVTWIVRRRMRLADEQRAQENQEQQQEASS